MKTILLLHGALGSQEQLLPLKKLLDKSFRVYTYNFPGHGGRPVDADFSFEHFADDLLQWLAENNLATVFIFGFSMGGYAGLYLAKHFPNLVEAVATLGTKLHWDEATSDKQTSMLSPEKMEAKVPAFAEELRQRHAPNDWRDVVRRTAKMMTDLGTNNPLQLQDFASINCPVLLMVGDRDNMVSLVETDTVYRQLKHGKLAVLPATHHPIEKADATMISVVLEKFYRV